MQIVPFPEMEKEDALIKFVNESYHRFLSQVIKGVYMESYITIISTLLGAIVGFFLSWLKEYIQSKPKLKTELKKGKFYYYKEFCDGMGNIYKNITSYEEANRLYLLLRFDVINIIKQEQV